MKRPIYAALAGSLLAAGSAAIMAGWIARWPVWEYFSEGGTVPVFNTALCLFLAGIAFVAPARKPGSALGLRTVLAGIVILVSATVLVQIAFNIRIGIDWPGLHRWYSDMNPMPGRMAPNTAIAILVGGIALSLQSRENWVVMMRHALGMVVLTMGLLGLFGYAFLLDLAYSWYGFPRMAFSSSLGMILFGACLLLEGYYSPDASQRFRMRGEAGIYAFLGAAVTVLLTVVAVSYGTIQALQDRARWVEHSYQVRIEFDDMAAVYRRGLAENGRLSSASTRELLKRLDSLDTLVADNRPQRDRLSEIRKLLAQAAGRPSAADTELDLIEAQMRDFDAEEVQLLNRRKKYSQDSAASSLLVIVAGNAAGFAMLLYAFWMLKRENEKRQHFEQQLSRNARFLDSLVENIPNMIFVKDAANLRFVRLNKAGEDLLGYGREELIGKNDLDFFPPHEARYFIDKDRAVLASGQLLDIPEEPIHTRHRGVRLLHTMKIPITDENGAPQYLLGLSEDITERKRAEQALAVLNEDLQRQAARLEATNRELESFSYSVSHDLRAPLRAVDGYALMLEEDYAEKLDQEGKRFLSVIRGNSQRMGTLIDDLLAFSRLGRQALVKNYLDMQQLVREVADEALQHPPGNMPALEIGFLPHVHADRALLRQVWVNLIGNAVKYSSKAASPAIRIAGEAGESEHRYWISDNGVGFSMEYYSKLFGVFQRLHHAQEFSGTGVGLAIVERIVSRHGGKIWAEGKLNQGATFYFTLPAGETDE